MSKIEKTFIGISALIILMNLQGGFLSKNKTEDFRPILERWKTLEPISAYSESLPKELEEFSIDQESSISRIQIGFRNTQLKAETPTTIINHLLNLEGGIENLKPLAFANVVRYQEMQKGRGIVPEKFPEKISFTLEVVSAFKSPVHTLDKLENDSVFFLQVDVSMIVGTIIVNAGSPELWKFDGESFHLLTLADSWYMVK